MAFEKGRKFSTGTSVHRKRQMSTLVEKEGHFGPALTVCPELHSLFFVTRDVISVRVVTGMRCEAAAICRLAASLAGHSLY